MVNDLKIKNNFIISNKLWKLIIIKKKWILKVLKSIW